MSIALHAHRVGSAFWMGVSGLEHCTCSGMKQNILILLYVMLLYDGQVGSLPHLAATNPAGELSRLHDCEVHMTMYEPIRYRL